MLNNQRKTVNQLREILNNIVPANAHQFDRLKGLSFYDWTNTSNVTTFNHAIGLPRKNGMACVLHDYEQMLYDTLNSNKHIWIKKSTGLGITEFILRYMLWLCLKDDSLKGSQMCIITGPREDLAIGLIDRMKKLFQEKYPFITFDTKETVIEVNGCHIESYPSNHLDGSKRFEGCCLSVPGRM